MKKKKSTILFHSYYEWIISVLILHLMEGYSLAVSIRYFLLAYFAFISIYEIGYLINDTYSIRFERNPRPRSRDVQWNGVLAAVWGSVRILVFLYVSLLLGVLNSKAWLSFYGGLIVIFTLHNVLRKEIYKPITFTALATFRFFAPIFFFLSAENLGLIFVPFSTCYLLYRLINYLDSKGFLMMPNRRSPEWKLFFYVIMLTLNALVSMHINNPAPFFLSSYYWAFWLMYYIASKNRELLVS